ncbi:MAG TPA: hypothetical protein EYH31_01560 [Anaerolineae bacterium]|nr:hypothetical protein [Anaerolineae bacterium]
MSVLAVEFDPPLEYERILASGGISLLVAVENRGSRTEFNVPVYASLLDPEVEGEESILLQTTRVIQHIEPGDVVIVRFERFGELPLRSEYRLRVQVPVWQDEVNKRDNDCSYDISITGMN